MNVISGFRWKVAENCALLRYYAANSGNFCPTFRDNQSVLFFRVQESLTLKMGLFIILKLFSTSINNRKIMSCD
jgi:hypothetical protein